MGKQNDREEEEEAEKERKGIKGRKEGRKREGGYMATGTIHNEP